MVNQSEIKLKDLEIAGALVMEVFDECAALMSVVNDFDGLFETYGDEDAKDDDEEVDEKVAACGGAVVRRMDVDHTAPRLVLRMNIRMAKIGTCLIPPNIPKREASIAPVLRAIRK